MGACHKVAEETLAGMTTILHHLHHHGIAHRDIKLENIRMSDDSLVHLLDFGLSDEIGKASRVHGGTSEYMPPQELIRRGRGSIVKANQDW
jgi:serine/threonine protein kinase